MSQSAKHSHVVIAQVVVVVAGLYAANFVFNRESCHQQYGKQACMFYDYNEVKIKVARAQVETIKGAINEAKKMLEN